MKKIFHIFLMLACASGLHAQGINYAWHHQMLTTASALYQHVVAMDNNDFVLSGNISSGCDVDPALNSGYFLRSENGNTFLSRITSYGELIWVVQFDSTAQLSIRNLSRDANGDLYICGSFSGTADMDPGADTLILRNSAGQDDAFFAKYSGQDGHLFWAKTIGTSQNDNITGISADHAGNVFLTGQYTSAMDFDPGPGIVTLPIASGYVGCVAAYDAQGNFVNAFHLGASGSTTPFDIAVDSHDRVYLLGAFNDTIDFDPGAGTFNLIPSGTDGFILKLSNTMQFINAIAFTGTASLSSAKLNIDPSGNLVAGGTISGGTIDFDGSAGTAIFTAAGTSTVFLTKQDTLLQYQSAWLIQGTNNSLAGFTCNAAGEVFMLFGFTGNVDVDPGAGTVTYNAQSGFSDMAIGRYSAAGQYITSVKLGNGGNDYPFGLATTANEKLICLASFQSLLDADPGPDTVFIKAISSMDVYLEVFDLCTPQVSTLNPVICKGQTYTVGNQTFSQSGNYNIRINSGTGCDTLVHLHLTVTSPDVSVCSTDTTITSNATNATYQWMNCNQSTLVGNGQSSFAVPDNDSYAVIVTQNGCADTSTCFQIYQRANAGQPAFAWANTIPFNDQDGYQLTQISKAGNIYVAGLVTDTSNFELLGGRPEYVRGQSVYPVVAVVKYDANRNYVWGFSFGMPITILGQNFPDVFSMMVDDNENLYINGVFLDSIDIDPGQDLNVLSAPTWSTYIAKFSAGGQLLWHDQLDFNGTVELRTMFTDKSGHVYCGGCISGPSTLKTGAGATALNPPSTGRSLLLLQLNESNGNYITHLMPPAASSNEAIVTGASCDHEGNIVIAGHFSYTIDFDPGAGTTSLTPFLLGQPDGFIAKYTPAMQLIWAKKKNAITSYGTFSVVTDCDDNIYVSGVTPYLNKYDSSGILINSFAVSGQGLIPTDMDIDQSNNIYLLYTLYDNGGTIGSDTFVAINNGYDMVAAKFRSDGQYDWAMQLGSGSTETPHTIQVDADENIYIGGSTVGTLDADASANTFLLYSTYYSPFLIKYGQVCAAVDTSVIGDSLSLSATDTNSYYQWIDCTTGNFIPGANGYTLPATVYGYVRLIVYQGDCVDTSGCHFSASTTAIHHVSGTAPSVFPNPSEHEVNIIFNTVDEINIITVYNQEGKEMLRKKIEKGMQREHIDVESFPPGIYSCVITNSTNSYVTKLIRE